MVSPKVDDHDQLATNIPEKVITAYYNEILTGSSAVRSAVPDGGVRQGFSIGRDAPAAGSSGACACALHRCIAAVGAAFRNIR